MDEELIVLAYICVFRNTEMMSLACITHQNNDASPVKPQMSEADREMVSSCTLMMV